MTEIRIPVPRLPAGMGSNLLGLAGLAAVAAAAGGLTRNWWWSALVAGVFAVVLAVIAQVSAQAATEPAARVDPVRPHLAATARSA